MMKPPTDLQEVQGWLKLAENAPRVCGFMYTPWHAIKFLCDEMKVRIKLRFRGWRQHRDFEICGISLPGAVRWV